MKIKKLNETPDEVREHLRARIRQQEEEIHRLRESLGGKREAMDLIETSLKAVEAPKQNVVKIDKTASTKEVVSTNIYSDWHIGEVTNPEETENFGEFNYAVAEQRLQRLAEDQIRWADKQRNAYNIQDAALLMLGDWVSGDIHRELEVTNEFPVPVQAVKAGVLMGELFRTLSPHFREVRVYEVAGDNHGRLTRKPQAKQKGFNNWSFVTYTVANQYCSNIKNIKIVSHQGMKDIATIAGKNFLMEHGDTIKSHMGIPLYGILRSRWREAARRMNTDRTFDYYALAHFHVPYWMETAIIGNGSLTGTSEFDHSCGRHAKPSQVAFLTHPAHGIFNFTPFEL